MGEIVKVESAEVVDTGCDHAPIAIEFRVEHRIGPDGKWYPARAYAQSFACWKCGKALPLDFKHLVL